MVLCYLKDDLAVAYQKKGKLETDIHFLNDIIPEIEFVGDVELNKEENICFVAGSTLFTEQFNSNKGEAVISALKIGPEMSNVSTKNFGHDLGAVLSIKKSTKNSSIYLGCHTAILEVFFDGIQFNLLNIMKLGKSDIVIDFYICDEGEIEGRVEGKEIYYLTKKAPNKIRNMKYLKV